MQNKKRFLLKALLACSLMATNAHAARPMRGNYEVPVQDATLKTAAIYPVKFKLDGYESNPDVLDFPLPTELVGAPLTIHMEKNPAQDGSWSGSNVVGNCQQVDRDFQCNVAFTALPIDAQAVNEAIRAKYTSPLDAQLRSLVAASFQSEPKGVISYRLRGRDRANTK